MAGEIIRNTYTGWAPADVAAFSSMLMVWETLTHADVGWAGLT